MINELLDDFISEIKTNQSLLHETAFSAVMGDHESYFQRKFAYSIRNNPRIKKDDTVANESFDKVDLVFYHKKTDTIHFVELKSMPLPLANQGIKEYTKKRTNAINQLTKRKVALNKHSNPKNQNNSPSLKGRYWIFFVFIDFNESFINTFAKDYPVGYDCRINSFKWDGIFQNQYSIIASQGASKKNKSEIFKKRRLNWINLPLSNAFPKKSILRVHLEVEEVFSTRTHISRNLPSK